jgi:hypothetical protein
VLTIPAAAKHAAKALEVLAWVLTDEPQLEVYARSGNLPSRTDLTENEYFAADPRLTKTAEALAIAQTPWTFRFNDMSNDASSPWIELVRTAIFEGDIDAAIARAKQRMKQIQCNPVAAAAPRNWEIDISEPRRTYWLNHYPSVGHTIYKQDFEATVAVAADATVVVRVIDGNDRQIDNGKAGPDRQQIIAGVVDQPLGGQMLRLDVVRVEAR